MGLLFFMEPAGVEPASENLSTQLSPGADILLNLPYTSPDVRLSTRQLFYA